MTVRTPWYGLLLLAGLTTVAQADDFTGRYVIHPSEKVAQLTDDNGQPRVVLTVSRQGEGYRLDLSALLPESGFADIRADRRVDGQSLAATLDYGKNDPAPLASGIAGTAMHGRMPVTLYRVATGTRMNALQAPTPRVIGSEYFLVAPPMFALELDRLSEQ